MDSLFFANGCSLSILSCKDLSITRKKTMPESIDFMQFDRCTALDSGENLAFLNKKTRNVFTINIELQVVDKVTLVGNPCFIGYFAMTD